LGEGATCQKRFKNIDERLRKHNQVLANIGHFSINNLSEQHLQKTTIRLSHQPLQVGIKYSKRDATCNRLAARDPLVCVEQRKTPPLSQPIRNAVSSSELKEMQVTPICLLAPTLARSVRGRLSVSSANLTTNHRQQFVSKLGGILPFPSQFHL